MEKLQLKFRKEDLVVIGILSCLLALELLTIVLIPMAQKLPFIISIFISSIKILAPLFLFLNIFFLLSTFLFKEKKEVADSWATYFRESLRSAFSSSVISTLVLLSSVLLGFLVYMGLSKIYNLPPISHTVEYLRLWVARNTY
ncbi:MAG: hypothetical protein PHQ96_00965 [Candidatus Omnitrophica bacterium]|nr:hypothetical protein [Candidatus Omnitrophota bacterium]